MLVEQEQISKLPEYKEEAVVERDHIIGVLNYCFKNVKPTEEIFLHQFEKTRTKGMVPTVPYYVPDIFLSCLQDAGADVSLEIEKSLVRIGYEENNRKTTQHHLYGFFRGELNGEEVTGAMIGSCTEVGSNSPPDISSKREIRKLEKILQKMDHGMVEDDDYIENMLFSN